MMDDYDMDPREWRSDRNGDWEQFKELFFEVILPTAITLPFSLWVAWFFTGYWPWH
jgi:hypothetical protein